MQFKLNSVNNYITKQTFVHVKSYTVYLFKQVYMTKVLLYIVISSGINLAVFMEINIEAIHSI